jgi:hypothetical protein
VENVRAWQLLGTRPCFHEITAYDASMLATNQLFRGGVGKALVHVCRQVPVLVEDDETALQVHVRHPQIAHDVQRHTVVGKNDTKKDDVGEKSHHLGRKLQEKKVRAFLGPVALNPHVH